MSTSAYKALTRDECYSIITKKGPLSIMAGRPNCHGLLGMISELSNVIQDIPCDYSAFGYLHKILPQNTYLSITGENIAEPLDPPLVPPTQANLTDYENDNLKILWSRQKAQWDQSVNVNLALIDFARSAFDGEFQRTLNNLIGVASSSIFLTWFNNIFDSYGKAAPKDITANENKLNLPWNPAQRDFTSVIRQIEDASIFSSFIGQPKADHDLSNAALKIVTDTGMFPSHLMTWYEEDDGTKTFNDLKLFLIAKINDWYRAGCTTASQAGYAGNVEEEVSNEAAEQEYYAALKNFGDANAHNAETFNTMANGVMAAITQINARLDGIALAAPSSAPAPAPPAPVYQQPPQQHYAPPPAPPAQYYQPPPQQQYYQPPQQPFQQGYGGYGGRGGRGGRGRGRSNGRGGRGRGYQQYQPQQQQQQYAPAAGQQQQQGGFYSRQTVPNNTKYYNNWNYCWSHGFDIDENHDSASCRRPAPGHLYHATRQNPCGGSIKGQHKTQLPTNY